MWSAAMDVGGWLCSLGLDQYGERFRDNKIDANVLPQLTADDLKKVGVAAVGDGSRLLAAIAALAESTLSTSANGIEIRAKPALASLLTHPPSAVSSSLYSAISLVRPRCQRDSILKTCARLLPPIKSAARR
jgi:hypothetical protein